MLAIGPRRGNKVATAVAPAVAPEWQLGKACEGLLELARRTGVTSQVTRLATNTATLLMNVSRNTLPN
jgi:hypothetical protein